jgi:cytochrome c-type biogenesis protein CcmH
MEGELSVNRLELEKVRLQKLPNLGTKTLVLLFLALQPLAAEENAVKRIQDRFLAPCCWQQSVAVHDSDIAKQMRAEIASMVANGQNEAQIIDLYVARYGERILREPRGANWWWSILVPLALIALATAGLVFFLRRQLKPPALVAATADLSPLPDLDSEEV